MNPTTAACQPRKLSRTVTMAVRNMDEMKSSQPKITSDAASRFILHFQFA
jgi:hypothetical protein